MASPTIPNEEIVVPSNKPSRKVAVIGAGAAGLVTARELLREGHKVVVFERHDRIGGTWIYNHNVESDPLGLDPSRSIIHTSLYDSLRTNLPREAMGFRDYPFIAKDGRQRDPRRFPCHSEVLFYLEDFTCHFQLTELIRLGTEVLHVGLGEEKRWVVRYRRRGQSHTDVSEEVYDAVVVCNGHYTEPRIAAIPGIDTWPGKQIHSHNYRVPEPFRDQVVVLIGGSVSASDISRDIAGVVKEVHVASRSCTNSTPTKQLGYDNIWLHSMIVSAHEDGTIVFQDGSSAIADVILYCTGFRYHFPFLETNNIVTVDDNRVGPLYHHIFPPQLAPWISFIGLPWKVLPFPLYEVQSKWVARVLSERIQLPSQEEMISNVEAFYVKLEAANVPKHYTHCLSDFKLEYIDYFAAECGFPASEEWRKQMCTATLKNMIDRPETYRGEWDDQHLILQAQDDFLQYF